MLLSICQGSVFDKIFANSVVHFLLSQLAEICNLGRVLISFSTLKRMFVSLLDNRCSNSINLFSSRGNDMIS